MTERPRNPKDIVGSSKPDLSLIPATAVVHVAGPMQDGAVKYGPGNWRESPVEARTYAAAAMRHIVSWLDGQEHADDSGHHHLAHAAAGLMILLDAQLNDKMVDNRLPKGRAAEEIARLTASTAPAAKSSAAPPVAEPDGGWDEASANAALRAGAQWHGDREDYYRLSADGDYYEALNEELFGHDQWEPEWMRSDMELCYSGECVVWPGDPRYVE